LSHQRKRKRKKKKKRVWGQFCECLSEAVAHLPATVSQLLLEALLIADIRNKLNTHLELSSHHHSYKLSRSKVAGWGLPLLPSLANLFIYSSVRDCPSPPFFGAQGAPPSLLRVFFFCCCLFSFFSLSSLGGESVCSVGYADLAQGCLWEYCMLLSSPGDLLLSSQ
jgi:hypothetical protein